MNALALWKTLRKSVRAFVYLFRVPSDLFPPFEFKIKELIELARICGLNVEVFQGYRSYEEQERLYAQGRTTPGKIVTNARPGYSWHNFGLAADLVFKKNGQWSWAEYHDWEQLGRLGKDLGLRWGGDWVSFRDRPHFQWKTSLTLAQARKYYEQGGLTEVWKHL